MRELAAGPTIEGPIPKVLYRALMMAVAVLRRRQKRIARSRFGGLSYKLSKHFPRPGQKGLGCNRACPAPTIRCPRRTQAHSRAVSQRTASSVRPAA